MKIITAKNKNGSDVKIRFNEGNFKVHQSDYNKLNDDNFEVFQEGSGFTDFKVEKRIIRKKFSTWLENEKCNVEI